MDVQRVYKQCVVTWKSRGMNQTVPSAPSDETLNIIALQLVKTFLGIKKCSLVPLVPTLLR